jgi:hypothetical protein
MEDQFDESAVTYRIRWGNVALALAALLALAAALLSGGGEHERPELAVTARAPVTAPVTEPVTAPTAAPAKPAKRKRKAARRRTARKKRRAAYPPRRQQATRRTAEPITRVPVDPPPAVENEFGF